MFTSWHNSNEIEKCVSLVSSFTTIRIFSENKISWGPSEGVSDFDTLKQICEL